jgi:hypothetical protein
MLLGVVVCLAVPACGETSGTVLTWDDPAVLKTNMGLSAELSAAGTLERDIGRQLHQGTTCPERLMSTVKTCAVTG